MNTTSESAASTPAAPAGFRTLRAAAILALFGIVLSIIHLVWPSPLMFTVFMLFGQSAFGLAMVLYGWVILKDLKHRKAL